MRLRDHVMEDHVKGCSLNIITLRVWQTLNTSQAISVSLECVFVYCDV